MEANTLTNRQVRRWFACASLRSQHPSPSLPAYYTSSINGTRTPTAEPAPTRRDCALRVCRASPLQYFPTFDELPLMDEYVDPNYYADVGGGTMLPIKHWCYFADIIDDSLSHMADFYHRTEVRDITGHCNSLLFNPDDFPDFRRLRKGSTCFVRYASKAYFSDLMTQVIKVDDTAFVKIIGRPMDELVILSQWYSASCCACCRRGLQQGHDTSLLQCPKCQVANYCSAECLERHKPEHEGHCDTCCDLQMVINVDMERFIQPVPFNTCHTQVFG